ncbi:MAG: hypothetical protein R6W97_01130 [Thiobacillus sp.]
MPTELDASLLLFHGLFSLFAAGISMLLIQPAYRSSPRRTLAYHFVLAFFIPVLGGIALILLAINARVLNQRYRARPYSAVRMPVFTAAPRAPALAFGVGSIRERLINPNLPKEMRLKALLTVQNMPGNLSTHLLREALSDPSDDLRMTAYGMLDKGEKHLNQQIQQELKRLEGAPSADERGQIFKQLAAHYWELAYQGYAVGELRDFSLNAAWHHAQDAAALRPQDGGLWVMIGRIALARHDTEQATYALDQAQKLAIPPAQVQTYLAELAFQRRDFQAVRRLVNAFGRQQISFSTAPLLAFWKTGAHP